MEPPSPLTRPATLADVAAHAGVSTATVSRYVNAPNRLIPETAAKVKAAVQALGYTPNFGAQALAARRTNTVGAIIPTMDNAIFATGIQAFQETVSAGGKTLLLASSMFDEANEEDQIRTLVARGAEGLLLIGHARSPSIYDFLEARQIPIVVAWAYDAHAPRLSVGFDNHAAMATLTRHVIEQGHRRIGMITAQQSGNDRVQARVSGVRAGMAEAGLNPENLTLVETTYGIAQGAAGLTEFMSQPAPPTVAICANDVIAVGALRQAQTLGLSVPGDISITGFDDMELATLVSPALTTVAVPHVDMGARAAQLLMKLIDGTPSLASVELPTAIKLRGSLAPPR